MLQQAWCEHNPETRHASKRPSLAQPFIHASCQDLVTTRAFFLVVHAPDLEDITNTPNNAFVKEARVRKSVSTGTAWHGNLSARSFWQERRARRLQMVGTWKIVRQARG